MRRLLSILTASLIVSSLLVAPAYAKDKGDEGNRGGGGVAAGGPGGGKSGNGNSASPGEGESGSKDGGKDKAGGAGRAKERDQKTGARAAAKPGIPAAAPAATVEPQLAGVRAGTKVNVVEVNDLIRGKRREALNKSLAANRPGIDRLRSSLMGLQLSGLNTRDAGDAIATRREADGSLTIFVDRGAD